MAKHVLYMSLRSPFARRCRVLLEELNVPYEKNVVDVFQPPRSYFDVHPLGRVPTLTTDSGEAITDSHQIMSYLEDKFTENALFIPKVYSKNKMRNLRSYAVGVMEMIVSFYLERVRPAPKQDLEALEEYIDNAVRTLDLLEAEVQNKRGKFLQGDALSVEDIDVGVAYGYYRLRMQGRGERAKKYVHLENYYATLMERSSFSISEPPV